MSAQQLVVRQRAELLCALCSSGVSEGLESVLDLLLASEVLHWEDHQRVQVSSKTLCSNARELLDLICTKGEDACALLLAAVGKVLPENQRVGLCSGYTWPALDDTPKELDDTPCRTLLENRLDFVRRLSDCISGALNILLQTGCFTSNDCDNVQLPLHTPSQQARRLLNLVKSKGDTAAKVLIEYVEQKGNPAPSLIQKQWTPPTACLQYQRKLRSSVSAHSFFLSTYGGTSKFSLDDIYTENQLELAHGAAEAQGYLDLEDIVGQEGTLNKEADTVLVSGEAGSGKSTLLQRLHLLWARGLVLKEALLLFPFSCRRLNSEQGQMSVKELLFQHCCWPDKDQDQIWQFILEHPHLILFTFDGLDELKQSFSDEQRHCCPTQPAPIHTLLFNLLQGSLMKGVRKIVTSRPEGVGSVLKMYLRKEVLLKGFSLCAIACFVKKHHCDPTVATRVIESLQSNTALLGLCHTPVFCWIVSKCYEELLRCGVDIPMTITDVYLMILQHFFKGRHFRKSSTTMCWMQEHLNTALHLGQLALGGIESSCYVFSHADLHTCGVTEEDKDIGFLTLSENLRSSCYKHYEFLHVTMQCFFAALYIVLNNRADSSAIRKLFQSQHRMQKDRTNFKSCLTLDDKHDGLSDEAAIAAERPNLQITATFVSGLLSQRHRSFFMKSCSGPTLDRKGQQVAKCLFKGMEKHFKSIPKPVEGENKSMHAMPDFIWLIKCIYEMQESRIAIDCMAKLEVEHLKLTYCNIGPVECTALAFVLQHMRNPVGLQLDNNSVGDVGVEQLLPCLHVCHSLYLRNNNISDEGIHKLIKKGMQCENFQKIALFNNKLTDACTKYFSLLLRTKQNFLALRLGNNYITAEGAKHLADGLRFHQSIKYLGLWGNKLGDTGATALAGALKDNKTLVWLSLVDNCVGNAGAFALSQVIRTSNTIEELWLTNNCITKTGVEDLVEALVNNRTVKAVWLRGNDLSQEEVEEMTQRESRLTF